MSKIAFLIIGVAALLANIVDAGRILVLVDSAKIKGTHSVFLKSLEDRGHSVTVKMADDSSLSIIKFGEFLFDHLVILAPTVEEFGGSLNVPEITKFIDGGGNVFVAGSSTIGDAIRDLAAEVGFEFDEEKTEVIDHHHVHPTLDGGLHTTLVVPGSHLIDAELIAGNRAKIAPVIFRGKALIADTSNRLRLVVLTAPTTAYSADTTAPLKDHPSAVGKSVILVGAMQARNNARVVITGSLDLLSNAFIDAKVGDAQQKSGNADLVTALSKWLLKESGVLRVKSVHHAVVGETKPPVEYTIMDNVNYEIDIEEMKDGKWVPFQGKDVQLEFVRIDPFIRATLRNNNGKLSTTFKVPDVYGVYKFLVDYRRVGYTHLYNVQQVSVRPLKHTQYERFSRCAYPYYVSAFSMFVGLYLFTFVFLYHKDGPALATAAIGGAKNTPKNK